MIPDRFGVPQRWDAERGRWVPRDRPPPPEPVTGQLLRRRPSWDGFSAWEDAMTGHAAHGGP